MKLYNLIICFIFLLFPLISLYAQIPETDSIQYRYNQSHHNAPKIPNDVNDCFHQLDSICNDSIKQIIKKLNEDDFIFHAQFKLKPWIENNWLNQRNSRLRIYFIQNGIYHPNDMNDIVLNSYHRYLCSKHIQLDLQFKFYRTHGSAKYDHKYNPKFSAYTPNNELYKSIDSALIQKHQITEINLSNFISLPENITEFKNLKSITIEKSFGFNLYQAIEILTFFPNLEELYFFENGFLEYPINLGKLSSLKDLWIDGDSIRYLPNSIKNLSNLTSFNISNCDRVEFDSLLIQLSYIETLNEVWLNENKLYTIPQNIILLTQIEDLWLNDNYLHEIPQGVLRMNNLQYLGLFNNDIEPLNISNGDLPNLKNINLCYNNFETLPMEIVKLKSLKRITMWHSNITMLPNKIKKLKHLEYLNLEGNQLSKIQKEKIRITLTTTELRL